MKSTLFLFLITLTFGCSPSFSDAFKYNDFRSHDGIQISNGKLNFQFTAFGDIEHLQKKSKIRKRLKELDLSITGDLLVFGETTIDPTYIYVVSLNSDRSSSNYYVTDTVINKQKIQFIGFPLEERYRRNMESDLQTMFNSLQITP